jgi:uncharacterized membrane protein YgcG
MRREAKSRRLYETENVMNFDTLRKSLLLGAATIFVWWAWKAPAQDTTALNASARAPYAVSQVIQLEQAKIGDDTVIAYIRSSGNNYNLSANDILYLRQEGVSDAVLTAMLTQPRASVASVAVPSSYSQPVAPAPQYSAAAPAPDTSAYANDANYADTAPAAPAQPPVTYVQSAPSTYYYPSSYYYPYSYSYPYYGYSGYYGWPGWGWGWWGGGWHWGWGYHGGWNTGWHGGWGGGSWHGGWGGGGFHGVVGGGFHGGGGGGGFHGGGGGGFHGGGHR